MVFLHTLTAIQLLRFATVISLLIIAIQTPRAAVAIPLTPSNNVGNGADIEFKRYCSNTLSEAIRLICGGRYNSLARKFPDSVGSNHNKSKRFAPDDVFYRPLQNGPIHECCRRPCGYSELKMYCAPD